MERKWHLWVEAGYSVFRNRSHILAIGAWWKRGHMYLALESPQQAA